MDEKKAVLISTGSNSKKYFAHYKNTDGKYYQQEIFDLWVNNRIWNLKDNLRAVLSIVNKEIIVQESAVVSFTVDGDAGGYGPKSKIVFKYSPNFREIEFYIEVSSSLVSNGRYELDFWQVVNILEINR